MDQKLDSRLTQSLREPLPVKVDGDTPCVAAHRGSQRLRADQVAPSDQQLNRWIARQRAADARTEVSIATQHHRLQIGLAFTRGAVAYRTQLDARPHYLFSPQQQTLADDC
jgi:hypothetical protein